MGRRSAHGVAARFGRSILELGGNNAAIVTPSGRPRSRRPRHRVLGGRHGRTALHDAAAPDRAPLDPRRGRRASERRVPVAADRRPAAPRHARRPAHRRRRVRADAGGAGDRRQPTAARWSSAASACSPTSRRRVLRRAGDGRRCRRDRHRAERDVRADALRPRLRPARRRDRAAQRRAAGAGVEHLHRTICARPSSSSRPAAPIAASPTSTSARPAPRSAARSAAKRRPAAVASPAPTPGRRTCAGPRTRSTTHATCRWRKESRSAERTTVARRLKLLIHPSPREPSSSS